MFETSKDGKVLYDHFGKPLSEVFARDRAIVETARGKVEAVMDLVTRAAEENVLETEEFVVIAVNIFVATEGAAPVYLPAEVALARLSLRAGLQDTFQAFPEPGPIPLGYKRLAMEASEQGHRIPLANLIEPPAPLAAGAAVEFRPEPPEVVCRGVLDFLAGAKQIFCPAEAAEEAAAVLDSLFLRAGRAPPRLALLPLHALLHQLAPCSVLSLTAAGLQLERDRFEHCPGLSCAWHAAHTDTASCSAATVRRLAYTLLDLACPQHGITLEAGRHLPLGTAETPGPVQYDWGPEEEVVVAPEPKNYFTPRAWQDGLDSGFGATDLRLRAAGRAPAYPPRQPELLASGQSVGTISDFLGGASSGRWGGRHTADNMSSTLEELSLAAGEDSDEGDMLEMASVVMARQ